MNRFSNIMPELVDVVRRFPVPVACCVWAFVFNTVETGYIGRGFDKGETLGLMAAFLAGGAAHLVAESRSWIFPKALIFAAVAAGIAGLLAFDLALLQSHRLFLFLGLILLLFVSPYLRRGVEQGAVWLFGLRVGLAALLALVVGLTLMLGLFAIVEGLNFLFNIDLGEYARSTITSLSIFLVGPLFGLSMIPRDLNEMIDLNDHKGGLLERGVSILVNYIKVPLAFIYALLLHAYAVKIIALQSMPSGEVGTVVTLFAIAGTLAWLLAWPFRETGTRLLKLYSRYWFWFLPVPVVLLALAVWQRVADHGMTPDRYGLVLVAAWAALVCIYLMLRRSFADMRVVIGAAAALLLVGSFGPLGAIGTTLSSQIVRFEKFLTDNAMLENGKLKAVLPELNADTKKQGHSYLEVFAQAGAMNIAEAYLPAGEKLADMNSAFVSEDVSKRFGVNNYWQDASVYSFNATAVPVSLRFNGEGRVAGPFQFGQWALNTTVVPGQPQFAKQNEILTVNWKGEKDTVALTFTLNQRVVLELIKYLRPLEQGQNHGPLTHVVSPTVSLIITEGSGQLNESKAELNSLNFWVIEKK